MKISELIKKLEEFLDAYGDLDVKYYDDVFAWQEIQDVDYEDYFPRVEGKFIGLA